MQEVYKLCHLKNNYITNVLVFIGKERQDVDLNELYRKDHTHAFFNGIFTEQERADYKEADIIFVYMRIHLDDTIETIKKKYILSYPEVKSTYYGLYLFAKTERPMSTISVYRSLVQNVQSTIERKRLIQYLLNMDDFDVQTLPYKEEYDYEDLLSLDFTSRETWLTTTPVGQMLNASEGTYPYTYNPFNVIELEPFLVEHSNELLTTTNQRLLMHTTNIYNRTLYVCHVEDVFDYATTHSIEVTPMISIYYPYLRDKDILSLKSYQSNLEQLRLDTQTMIQDRTWLHNIETIDLLTQISSSYSGEDFIVYAGIKRGTIILNPDITYNLPLDVVFKLIHSNIEAPLIKFNPSRKQENIYRLYANTIATDGRRIPYLPKSTIFKLMKQMAGEKQVSVFIQSGEDTMILSFFDTGRLEITVDFNEVKPLNEMNTIIATHCNPIIEMVSNYLQQRGYTLHMFEDVYKSHVGIENMQYRIETTLTKKIRLKPFISCISSVFNVMGEDEQGTVLRLKKVEHYNEMDSKEAYIVESLNAGVRDVELIKGLIDNFQIKSEEDARGLLVDFVSRQQVVQEAFKNKRFKIKNNPGFLTRMNVEKYTSRLITNVDGINHIGYLNTIPDYIQALIIMSQGIQSPELTSSIDTLCKVKTSTSETRTEDLIAPVEEPNFVSAIVFNPTYDASTEPNSNGLLQMLLGDSDDENTSDEEDTGGAPIPKTDLMKDITGMNLSNPNPFSDRLSKREPKLFLTSVGPGYSSYSRSCPSSNRRQPVILTQGEKDRIDKEHPGSYEHVVSYQSSKDTPKYYYICPRYWSLKEGVSLTQSDVNSGKYGEVIPKKAKEIAGNKHIYEFDGSYHRNEKGEYENTNPGFMKPSKHPDGKCMPCCFKGWDVPAQVKLRQTCEGDQPPVKEVKKKLKLKAIEPEIEKFDEYVKGPEKFPLENGRIGYLPVKIQQFLHIDNKQCQISQINTNVKPNTPCIVRLGVEKSVNQSFIAAIACIYSERLPDKPVPTILQMKVILMEALDLDIFLTLQNGNLITIFNDDKEVNLDNYKYSSIYKKINTHIPEELSLLKKIIGSYENFKRYLNDPDIEIGYEYLWDLICFNNDKLFEKGLNMVILETKDDDLTGNVSVICPTNHYSTSFFDVNKKTVIFIKRENMYEPIVTYEDKIKQYVIIRRFSIKYKGILPELKIFLDMIKTSLQDKCSPLPSRPRVYKFKRNIMVHEMVHILKLKKYIIHFQILNYNGKVIGLDISKGDLRGMIPVFPSAMDLSMSEIQWIDQYKGYSYKHTLNLLNSVYKETKGHIPSTPVIKVVEDDLIVGIITQTNQFVPINPPTQDVYGKDLELLRDVDYLDTDKVVSQDNTMDDERIRYMHRIQLETGFFNTFRNMVRMQLGMPKHYKLRNEIEGIVTDEDKSYYTKLREIETKLHSMTDTLVQFIDIDETLLQDVDAVIHCNTLSKSKCASQPYCLSKENSCVLLIPKQNLITDIDNSKMYYGRMTDEIVRYSRIRSFLFEPTVFLNFSEVKYNLREDEVILVQSLLTQEYFDDLIPRIHNPYIQTTTYETTEPLHGERYSNVITPTIKSNLVPCPPPKLMTMSSKWKSKFPHESMELKFSNDSNLCSFDIVLTILQDYDKEVILTVSDIRSVLADEYSILFEKYSKSILSIMRAQGKSIMAHQLNIGRVTITDLIVSDHYFITPLDIWVISRRFLLPIVLYTSTLFVENKKNILLYNVSKTNDYYFIKVPAMKQGYSLGHKLLVYKSKSLINVASLPDLLQEITLQNTSEDLLVDYLEHYKPKRKTILVIDRP
jgi:hypothetical protein